MPRWFWLSGLAVIALAITGCGSPLVRVTEHFSLDAPWQDYQRVVVRTANGHVELLPGTGDEIQITGVKQAGGLTLIDAQHNLEQLTVIAEPDAADPTTFVVELQFPELLRHRSIGASFDVSVPESCAADIKTGNGYIRARGLKDRVTLQTSNGRITVEDANGRVEAVTRNGRVHAMNIVGELEIDTSNGRIIADSVDGNCRLTTSNGSVEARAVVGDLRVTTSNGGIIVNAEPAAEGEVILRTSNGSIRAELPPNIQGTLSLRCSNGRLDTDFDESTTLTRPRWSKHSFEAQLNGGGDGRIEAYTSNGSITLNCR
jgi:hypothetical protein